MSYIFRKTRDNQNLYDLTDIVFEIENGQFETTGVQLSDLLMDFERFLRGCGFVIDGHLELVQSNNDTLEVEK